ncbi:hypothetical protein R1flu_009728 [Riccia fluitans]|uniref:Uncharacterized protein n=1 Tax=Riccia fluitans TaxID=41844 RepID=A0ABD1Z2Z7_9MARC
MEAANPPPPPPPPGRDPVDRDLPEDASPSGPNLIEAVGGQANLVALMTLMQKANKKSFENMVQGILNLIDDKLAARFASSQQSGAGGSPQVTAADPSKKKEHFIQHQGAGGIPKFKRTSGRQEQEEKEEESKEEEEPRGKKSIPKGKFKARPKVCLQTKKGQISSTQHLDSGEEEEEEEEEGVEPPQVSGQAAKGPRSKRKAAPAKASKRSKRR